LVAILSITDEFQQEKSVGPMESGGTRKQLRGQLSPERGEKAVLGQFPLKDMEFFGPFPPLGNIAADLEDVAAGIAFPGGRQDPAEKSGGAGERLDQET
jgi:hypothetical protein